MRKFLPLLLLAVVFVATGGLAFAGDPAPAAEKPVALGNVRCPVSGSPVDPSVTTAWSGVEVAFCCPGCIGKFTAEPAKYMPALLKDLAAQAKAAKTEDSSATGDAAPEGSCGKDCGDCKGGCKGGEKAGECPKGGECPKSAAGGGCKGGGQCPKGGAEPAGEPKSEAAPAALEVVDLQNAKCPVMEGNPTRATVTAEYRNIRIRFCCPGCGPKFQADPEKYLAKLATLDPDASARLESARGAWAHAHPGK